MKYLKSLSLFSFISELTMDIFEKVCHGKSIFPLQLQHSFDLLYNGDVQEEPAIEKKKTRQRPFVSSKCKKTIRRSSNSAADSVSVCV